MARETSQSGAVRLKCICGEALCLDPELLGRAFRCPHCGRYLHVGLQFVLMESGLAPNLTALCTCGRFIVEKPGRAGKTVRCRMCGRRVVLPKPVERPGAESVIRVSPKALERQLKRLRGEHQGPRLRGQAALLQRAGLRGRINLRPGQEVCVNPDCGLPLPLGANVCSRCGVNVKTGVRYEGVGPERDPKGKWKRI